MADRQRAVGVEAAEAVIVTPATESFLAGYLYILLACLIVCLVLDVLDVVRYHAGEGYVLGSPGGPPRPDPPAE